MTQGERFITDKEFERRQALYDTANRISTLEFIYDRLRGGEKAIPDPESLGFDPLVVVNNLLDVCHIVTEVPERVKTDPEITTQVKDLLEAAHSSLPMLEGR